MNVNQASLIINMAITLFCGIFMAVVPGLTRKDYLFGVKIPQEGWEHPTAQTLKRRYIAIIAVASAGLLIIEAVQYLLWPGASMLATISSPFLLVAVQFVAYLSNHRRAKSLKRSERWRVQSVAMVETRSSHTRGSLASIPWLWHMAESVYCLALILLTLANYSGLPERIPIHFDANMVADAYRDKSIPTALMFPLTILGMTILLVIIAIQTERAKLQVSPSNPELSFAQHRMYRRRMGHALGFANLGGGVAMSTLLLPMFKPEWQGKGGASMLALSLILPYIPLVVVTLTSGQGGCRLRPKITEAEQLAGGYAQRAKRTTPNDKDDDDLWFLGLFYYNPQDPSIIVESRFGNDLGFNYAHPVSKIIVVVSVLGVLATLIGIGARLLT